MLISPRDGHTQISVNPQIFTQDGATHYHTWNMQECTALIKHEPKHCWAHLRQVQLFISESKFQEAEDSLAKIYRIDQNWNKHFQLEIQGDIIMKKNDKEADQALKYYR